MLGFNDDGNAIYGVPSADFLAHLTGFLRVVFDDLVHRNDGRKVEETVIGGALYERAVV